MRLQPRSGFTGSCVEDAVFVENIADANPNSNQILIADARYICAAACALQNCVCNWV